MRGPASAALVLGYNIVCETWLAEPEVWHMVRGAVMLLAMKVISLGFDLDAAAVEEVERAARKKELQADPGAGEGGEAGGRRSARAASGGRGRSRRRRGAEEQDVPDQLEDKEEEEELLVMPGWFQVLSTLLFLTLDCSAQFAGYCLCPGTVVLGPWVSYQEYCTIYRNPRWNPAWAVKVVFTVLFAFMFLTIRYFILSNAYCTTAHYYRRCQCP